MEEKCLAEKEKTIELDPSDEGGDLENLEKGPSFIESQDSCDGMVTEEKEAGAVETRLHVQGLMIAQALEGLGFYEPIEASEEVVFPDLPPDIIDDINIGFGTFAMDEESPLQGLQPSEERDVTMRSDK